MPIDLTHPLGDEGEDILDIYMSGIAGITPEATCSAFVQMLSRLLRLVSFRPIQIENHEPWGNGDYGRPAWEKEIAQIREWMTDRGQGLVVEGERIGVDMGALAGFLAGAGSAIPPDVEGVRKCLSILFGKLRSRRLSTVGVADRPEEPAPRLDQATPAVAQSAYPSGFDFLHTFQRSIMEKLDGVALRSDALAHKLGVDKSRLYKRNGIKELKARGLVLLHRNVGYFRPDKPPRDVGHPHTTNSPPTTPPKRH